MKKKKAIKVAQKYFKWWTYALGLRWYITSLNFVDHMAEEGEEEKCGVVGKCYTKWEYLQATITLNCYELKKLSESEIEKVVIHELMHVFLNEMRDGGNKHEERVATQLTDAFGWVVQRVKDDMSQ